MGNPLEVETEDRFASNGELIPRSPLKAEREKCSKINNGLNSKHFSFRVPSFA